MSDHEEYLAKVRKYDDGADPETVKKLANRLGIALRNRDSSTVACSDPSELRTVRDGFCKKTLGLDDQHSDDEIMDVLKKVCEEMSGDGGNKHRVPFYYLVAKHTGTLDKI
jgi:hypothetical protein